MPRSGPAGRGAGQHPEWCRPRRQPAAQQAQRAGEGRERGEPCPTTPKKGKSAQRRPESLSEKMPESPALEGVGFFMRWINNLLKRMSPAIREPLEGVGVAK